MKFPIKIQKIGKNTFFLIKYDATNLYCKNKWGFFFSNLCFELYEKPFIKNNSLSAINDTCYFYVDIKYYKPAFKNEKIKKKKLFKKKYNIFVKLNNFVLNNLNTVFKIIFINNKKQSIFAIANVDLSKKTVELKNINKKIKIKSFL